MKTKNSLLNLYLRSISLGFGFLILIIFSIQNSNGQALGGIPDGTINPGDTGALIGYEMFQRNADFMPLTGKRSFIFLDPKRVSNGYQPASYGYIIGENGDGNSNVNSENPGTFGRGNSIHFFSTDEQYVVGYPNYFKSFGGVILPFGLHNYDSLSFYKIGSSPFPYGYWANSTKIVLLNPFKGDFRDGLKKRANGGFVYTLSYNQDTSAVHNEIHLFNLDENAIWRGSKHVIQNALLEKIDLLGDKLYVLYREQISGTAGATLLKVFDAQLQELPNNFANLNANLLGGKPEIFKMLADGKILIAGRIWNGVSYENGLVRLETNGGQDPTFTAIWADVSMLGLKWDLGNDGIVRMAWVKENGNQPKAVLSKVGTNGGQTGITEINWDKTWPLGMAKMYHPEMNAFLFETGIIIPKRSANWGQDTIKPTVFRFYLGYDQSYKAMVNTDGLFPFMSNSCIAGLNKRLKQVVNYEKGYIGSIYTRMVYNKKPMPFIQLMNWDGSLDSSFKGFLAYPKIFRDSVFNDKIHPWVRIVGKKKLLFGNRLPKQACSETYRYHFDGQQDITFIPYRASEQLLELKDGSFAGLRFSDTSIYNHTFGKIDLIRIDSLGNFQGVSNSYQFIQGLDFQGTVGSGNRFFNFLGEDNKKGIWLNVATEMGSDIKQIFWLRFDPNGSYRRFSLDSLPLLKNGGFFYTESRGFDARVLNDKSFEIWSNELQQIAHNPNFNHRFLFDSTGRFVSKSPVFQAPDGFGPNTNQKIRMLRKFSDGKFLARLESDDFYNYYLRFFADGRMDPSFLPIQCKGFSSLDVIEQVNNHLVFAFAQPSNYMGVKENSCGPLSKAGLHAFKINAFPENIGYIQGKIEQMASPATGCNPVGTRQPGNLAMLVAQPGNHISLSNNQGFYSFALNPATYSLGQNITNNELRRQICPLPSVPDLTAHISQAGDVVLNQNFLNQTFSCARLNMSLLQPRFRLCSISRFTISYSNDGMAAEPDARIRLTLPPLVKIMSASKAYTIQTDSSYVFDIGNLAPGQSGSISISDSVGCISTPDSSFRACFSARLEPLSVCSEIDPQTINWDGAWLDAKAKYSPVTDKVRFIIHNKGNVQSDSTDFQFWPVQPSLRGRIKLAANDSLVFEVPPLELGGYSLVVRQPVNCPLGSFGTLRHTGRNTAIFYLSYSDGWFSQQTATACPAFRFSYDPNEKIVDPVEPVEPGTELTYSIHFENYGNDTAYAVIVADTLPAGLDITTFRMTGSSHDCEPRLDGTTDNPVVFFNFLPIRLPAKRQDSISSKGQVDFKIRLKENVALGSVHQNKAHIYFDRNEPIITNTTVTKVRNPDEVTEVSGKIAIENRMILYPNPTRNSVSIRLPNGFEKTEIRLTDIQGKVVLKRRISGMSSFDVSDLQGGVYLILADGLKTERLIVIH